MAERCEQTQNTEEHPEAQLLKPEVDHYCAKNGTQSEGSIQSCVNGDPSVTFNYISLHLNSINL